MYFWDYSFETPQENLAFDEALLEHMDALSTSDGELLRFWQMPEPCVVIGRSSKVALEVNLEACQRDRIHVLRRMSGGASIVAGPGCMMFSLLLSLDQRPECRGLDEAHRCVMGRMQRAVRAALEAIGSSCDVAVQGVCDLTIDGRKISGNALRLKRSWMIYHGTLLLDMPLEWIATYLHQPPKQPEYRQGREHRDFVASLGSRIADLSKFNAEFVRSSVSEWDAHRPFGEHPFANNFEDHTRDWVSRRYGDPAWHLQR
jgi:lipoate-protein ligase A